MSRVAAWYFSSNGKAMGPVATEMVKSMIRGGQIQALDLVFREGDVEWLPVASHSELSDAKKSWDRSTDLQDDFTPSVSPLVTWIVLRPHSGTYLQEGPYSTGAIAEGLKAGRFLYSQYAWRAGLDRWRRIGDLEEFDRREIVRGASGIVPPPLPDPIETVLLEDDLIDGGVEEFHVLMKAGELTPTPDFKSTVVVGGAATKAEEYESPAIAPIEPAIQGRDLAAPPWERGTSTSLTSFDVPSAQVSVAAPAPESAMPPSAPKVMQVSAPVLAVKAPSVVVPPERPIVLSPKLQDNWERWGRRLTAVGFAALAMMFLAHAFFQNSNLELSARELSASVGGRRVAAVHSAEQAPVANSAAQAQKSLAPAVVAALAPATGLSVVGVQLESVRSPEAGFVFEGRIPVGAKIEVSITGRLGQVFGVMNVRQVRTIIRSKDVTPKLRLSELQLPEGAYTVEAKIGDERTSAEFFVGVRDGRFISRLEYFLKEISMQTQAQKRELFYSVKELDVLARSLGSSYGQLRAKPLQWDKFYRKWEQDTGHVEQVLAGLRENKPEMLAYPEETAELAALYSSVLEAGKLYDSGVRQSHDIAGDTLTELISELERSRLAFGEISIRHGDGTVTAQ